MSRYRTKKTHRGIRDIKRAKRTRARVKDLDQIHDDLAKPAQYENLPEDADLPGMGQHYCLQCARFFTTAASLVDHYKTKIHKRRLKELKEGPYTQKDAEAAAGLFTDNGKGREERAAGTASAAAGATAMATDPIAPPPSNMEVEATA
ncbi:Bud site selection protein 20 [Geranomyces variabilis]|nr:Bud site selection protein 20 [Geranomyces variabilis]